MSYQEDIIEATGCTPEDAEEIEEIVRDTIFHTNALDWVTTRQLKAAARQAVPVLAYLREQGLV